MDLYLVEWSRREDDPWNPECVFTTRDAAEDYIKENEDLGCFIVEEITLNGDFSAKEFAYIMEFVKENEDLDGTLTMNRLRALWTAFALHQSLDTDTKQYNSFMYLLWSEVNRKCPKPYYRFSVDMSYYLE